MVGSLEFADQPISITNTLLGSFDMQSAEGCTSIPKQDARSNKPYLCKHAISPIWPCVALFFCLTSTHNETTSCIAFTVSDQIVSAEVTLVSFSIPCLYSLLSWLLPFNQIFSNSRYNPWTTFICFLTGPDFCSGHFIAEYLLLQENTSLFTFILSNSSTMKRVGVFSSHQLLLVNNYSICTYWVN